VQLGDNVTIGGFIISGTAPKKLILRGIGPSLQTSGITDVLADPVLELHAGDGSIITKNDNWKDDPSQAAQIQLSGLAPANDLESAIAVTLVPGAYTAIESGKGSGTGTALIEIYDVDTAAASGLANLSTRGLVQINDNVMIGGFTLGRTANAANLVLRAIGPSLSRFAVANPLANPTLEVRDSNGDKVGFNDDWNDDPAQAAQITAAGLAPNNSLESACRLTLAAGRYTVIVAGKNGGTGVAVVEIYRLP
jgi:hypothetical protein